MDFFQSSRSSHSRTRWNRPLRLPRTICKTSDCSLRYPDDSYCHRWIYHDFFTFRRSSRCSWVPTSFSISLSYIARHWHFNWIQSTSYQSTFKRTKDKVRFNLEFLLSPSLSLSHLWPLSPVSPSESPVTTSYKIISDGH